MGRHKRNTFNDIKEKIGKKLVGWNEKILSKAGAGPIAPPQRSMFTKVIFCGGVLVIGMDLDGAGYPYPHKLVGSFI